MISFSDSIPTYCLCRDSVTWDVIYCNLSYDSLGRLTHIQYDSSISAQFVLVYNNSYILEIPLAPYKPDTFYLNGNGFIQSYNPYYFGTGTVGNDSANIVFSNNIYSCMLPYSLTSANSYSPVYDQYNQFQGIEANNVRDQNLSTQWQNGDMVQITNYGFSENFTYYTDKSNADGDYLELTGFRYSQLQKYGVKNAHLLKRIYGSYGGVPLDISYVFNSNNNITKVYSVYSASNNEIQEIFSIQYSCQ